jgi:RNA polymerase primary sigma factor
VDEVRDAARTVTSLDRPIGEEGDTALGDMLEAGAPPVDQEVEVSLSEALLRRTIEELPETERDVIRLRFGLEDDEPQPLRETGRRLGLSAERVRQIESRALKRLAMRRELEALREVA